jgi:predicted Zn-dependent protease
VSDKVLAVVIRETNKGIGASEVINHDAATSYTAIRIYEKRVAIQKALYRLYLKGLKSEYEIFTFRMNLNIIDEISHMLGN